MVNKRGALRAACSALLVMFVLMEVAIGTAWARPRQDSDGTRMRARKAVAQKTIKDALSAPKDKHDWRYVEVDKAGQLTVTLEATPEDAEIELSILDGEGKLLKEAKAGRSGKRKVSVKTSPGIYYIDVTIKSGKATYTLDIKL